MWVSGICTDGATIVVGMVARRPVSALYCMTFAWNIHFVFLSTAAVWPVEHFQHSLLLIHPLPIDVFFQGDSPCAPNLSACKASVIEKLLNALQDQKPGVNRNPVVNPDPNTSSSKSESLPLFVSEHIISESWKMSNLLPIRPQHLQL